MADSLDKVVIKTNEAVDTLGKLRREMASLNSQLEDVEEGSAAFVKLQNELKKTEAEVSKVEGAFGDATDKIKTLSGSGVERFNASVGLMREGIQNLDLDKFKIGIQGATQAFGGLGKAIIATGIGALVAAIGYLIANFDELRERFETIDDLGKVLDLTMLKLSASFDKLAIQAKDGTSKAADAFDIFVKSVIPGASLIEEAYGRISKPLLEQISLDEKRSAATKKFIDAELGKRDEIKTKYEREIALAKSLGKNTDELELKYLRADKAAVEYNIKRIKSFMETTSLFDSILGPFLKKQEEELEKASLNLQIKENEINLKKVDNAKETAEKIKEITLDELADMADKELNEAEKNAEKLAALRLKYADETQMQTLDREEKAALLEAENLLESEENKQKIRDFYSGKRKELQDQDDKEIEDAQKEASDRRLEILKKEKEEEEKLKELKIDAVKNGLSTISSLTELFAGKSKESQRKAFNVQKGVSIAQAGIATFESATKAFNSLAGIPVVGPVLGGAAAAAAVAAGLANIKKIASQKFEGGGDKSPAPSPSNIGGGSGGGDRFITPPTFNLGGQQIGGAGTLLGSGFGQNQQQPIKVFVSETDISNVQNKVQVTEGNSLFEGPQ